MVTCCTCEPELAYDLTMFLQDFNEFMVYTTPVAICVVLWKIFVTNRTTPRGDITVLGLDESSTTYSPPFKRGVTFWTLLLYLLTGFTTFGLGVLAFEAVQALG
ncbi:MAG TPA: hypothetical protein VFZ71_11900 [Pyrinomonadaceae bacterium]